MNPQKNPTSTPHTHLRECVLAQNYSARPHSPCNDNCKAQPPRGIERKQERKGEQCANHAPAAAEWVLILNQLFIIVHTSCMASAPTSIPFMKCGMRIRVITYKQQP